MKKFLLILLVPLLMVLVSCSSQKKESVPPTSKEDVEFTAQAALKKYLNTTHDTDLKPEDIKIDSFEQKPPYKTKKDGKEMKNTWFVVAEAEGTQISAWIDMPDDTNFSITFLNYGIKNEISDIED